MAAGTLLLAANVSLAQAPDWRAPTGSYAAPMRAVSKTAVRVTDTRSKHTQGDRSNLQWRPSASVKPAPKATAEVFAAAQQTVHQRQQTVPQSKTLPQKKNVSSVSLTTATGTETRRIAQAAWMQNPAESADDFFNNPFGDANVDPSSPATSDGSYELPPPQPSSPANNLRGNLPGPRPAAPTVPAPRTRELNLPTPQSPELNLPAPSSSTRPQVEETPRKVVRPAAPGQLEPAAPAAAESTADQEVPLEPAPATRSRSPQEPSLGERLREEPPELNKAEELPPPSDSPSNREPFQSPFSDDENANDMQRLRDRIERNRAAGADEELFNEGEDVMKSLSGISCDDFRDRILQDSIRKVSLDISPPYRPDILSADEYNKVKARFDEKQVNREWRSLDGDVLAKGRLRDLAYEKAIIDTEYGTTEEVQINLLSEADLAYISENWGLPMQCRIPKLDFKPRHWTQLTMTWKASNHCHKPLNFENENQERYGHTHGPLVEPIVSSAHFFANIAVLPYKMGVHSPHECQYALGYYRPGNCAPWIKPPVPLSVKGAIYQGAYMTGMFWLIP